MKEITNVLLGVSIGINLTNYFGVETLDFTIGIILFFVAGLMGLGNPLKLFKN